MKPKTIKPPPYTIAQVRANLRTMTKVAAVDPAWVIWIAKSILKRGIKP